MRGLARLAFAGAIVALWFTGLAGLFGDNFLNPIGGLACMIFSAVTASVWIWSESDGRD